MHYSWIHFQSIGALNKRAGKKNGESTAYCLALKYTLKEVLQAKVVWYSTETELYKTWGVLERS